MPRDGSAPPAGGLVGYPVPIKQSRLDLRAARAGLRQWLPSRIGAAGPLRLSAIRQPPGSGAANETLLVTASWTAGGQPRRRRLVVRVATPDPLYPTPLLTQYRMYAMLAGMPGVPVPDLVGYDDDPAVLGVPFFVMDRVDGRVPTDNPPYTAAGWVAEATPAQRRRLWESAVAVLARLHGVDPGRAAFLRSGQAGSGLEEWLRYWVDYCAVAAGGSPHPTLAAGLDWLHAHRPARPVTELAWGDARIGNMVFRGFRVAAVLDWDLVSLGGCVSDLAWWVLREHPVAAMLPGIGTARETVDLWEQLAGRRAEDLDYHLVFAALRLGAIRLRLARQHAGQALGPGLTTSDNGGLQQLSVLLGLRRAGDVNVTLPDLGRPVSTSARRR